jgi:plasmid stability protein
LEQSVKAKLQRRAKRNGHSMEEEVRDILRNALKTKSAEEEGLGTRIQRRFAGIGFREEEIPKLPGQPARPADFKK